MQVKIRYINRYKDRHGRLRTYYRRGRAPQQLIEGDPGSQDWLDNYNRIHQGFEAPGRHSPERETLRAAVQAYIASPYFTVLATNTQSNYRYALAPLVENLGKMRVSEFTKGDVARIRDQYAKTSPTKAKMAVTVLKLVFDLAAEHDMITTNPAAGLRNAPGRKAKPHQEWRPDQIATFLEEANPYARRTVMVLLYTGLRCSDACSLMRSDIKNGMIKMETGKTNKKICITVHAELVDELATPLPVESFYLISGAHGQQMTRYSLHSSISRQFKSLGMGKMPSLHGLRRNAVAALVEARCDTREIEAITGQSFHMIQHYASNYNRSDFSRSAMEKWETKGK